jgi:hypothetical protein
VALVAVAVAAATPVIDGSLAGRQVFPVSNWWNQDISSAPVDSNSASYINYIGSSKALHPDFGPPPYGIPYIVVAGDQPLVPVTWTAYGDESDNGAPGRPLGYPIPDQAKTQAGYIEGNAAGGGSSGDRHMLLVDVDHWLLYETYATHWNASANHWEADSGATFNLSTNDRRPEGWTSTDAAGLAVFPGLVKYDEAFGTAEITHAIRFTVRATKGYVWPASHSAGSTTGAPPLGTRLRLKASKNLSAYRPEIQRIFRAMQKYGLILADNGSDMYVSGTMDSRWDNGTLNPAFGSVTASDFDVIQLGWKGSTATPPKAPTNLRIVR